VSPVSLSGYRVGAGLAVFDQYDEGPVVADEKGIATFGGDAKVAYFKDPDGNVLSIAQAGATPEVG
jgi:hypothetical protein